MTPSDPPTWPPTLTDETPLPFAVWRVMNFVDGHNDLATIAQLAGVSIPEVQDALAKARQGAKQANQKSQKVSDALAHDVAQCVIAVQGPIGEFMVDDALDELGDAATLQQLLDKIMLQLSDSQKAAFVRNVRAKGIVQ